jgi:hypothetical protein
MKQRDQAYMHLTRAERDALLKLALPSALREKLKDPNLFGLTLLDQYYLHTVAVRGVEIEPDAAISDADNGAYVMGWVWVDFPKGQWLTRCPECGGEGTLKVTEVTLEATGARVWLNTTLGSDGFEVNHPDAAKNGSTSDEHVICAACTTAYTLAELSLD